MKFSYIYKCVLAAALSWPMAAAGQNSKLDKYHAEIAELSIEDNINSPEVPVKYSDGARDAMRDLAVQMQKGGLATDLGERGGMVLMVTVAASDFFAPNDTALLPAADKILKQIMQPLRTPDRYKLLVAVHSDNTGSDDYLTYLTQARADAILGWIESQGVPTAGVVTYGMGNDEPIATDSSREGRRANRRVELYFVPGPVMIDELKAKKR